ncbi:MAG: N-acetyltransferase [Rhodanobacteraceae bacterium]|nr:N-acetyltransferase [Rhodanobacteraceae bacterium]
MTVIVRNETATDVAKASEIIEAAFRDHPHSDGSESRIVQRLRTNGDLAISLVAEDGNLLVGYAAFSPVTLSPTAPGWYGLGPVAVHPSHQAQGIGSALIHHGLNELISRGASGCVVFGSSGYYERFGFLPHAQLRYPGGPEQLFLARAFAGAVPQGTVAYSAAFGNT